MNQNPGIPGVQKVLSIFIKRLAIYRGTYCIYIHTYTNISLNCVGKIYFLCRFKTRCLPCIGPRGLCWCRLSTDIWTKISIWLKFMDDPDTRYPIGFQNPPRYPFYPIMRPDLFVQVSSRKSGRISKPVYQIFCMTSGLATRSDIRPI